MADDADTLFQQARQARRDARLGESRDLYQRAADAARATHDHLRLVHALRHLCELNREVGALDRALQAGDEAVRLCRSTPGTTTLDTANAERVLALAHQLSGHAAEAGQRWRAARGLYEQCGIQEGVAEADRQLASIATLGAAVGGTDPQR